MTEIRIENDQLINRNNELLIESKDRALALTSLQVEHSNYQDKHHQQMF